MGAAMDLLAVMPTGATPPAAAVTPDPKAELAAKIKKYKPDGYPEPGNEGQAVQYLKTLTSQTDPDAQARHRQAARNMLYAYGKQRLTWSKRTRAWEELPLLDEKDARVTDNCILPSLRSRSQRLLSGPIQWDATPKRNDLEARDRAKLGAEWLTNRWKHTSMVAKVDQGLMLSFCCGVSCLKSFWNRDLGTLTPAEFQRVKQEPAVDQMGQPIFDPITGAPMMTDAVGDDGEPVMESYYVDRDKQEVASRAEAFMYRPGDTDTATRSVFNVRINPDATAWDPGAGLRWLLDSDILPVETAKAMFSDHAERIHASQQDDASAVTLERLAASAATASAIGSPGILPATAPNRKAVPTVPIQEYWELPNDCFPDGRLIVRVGEVIVYDDAFPDGVFPYTPLFDEPAPLTAMGRPSVNDMVPLQDTINRQWTAIDQEARLSGVGRWVSWELPGIPEQLTPEDRTVIQVPMNGKTMHRSLKDMFHRLDPAQAGSDRWRLLDQAKRALQDVAAFHEVSRGQVPPGVDSGVAIEHLLEEERGQLAKAIRALKSSLEHWGSVQMQIARKNYGSIARWLGSEEEDMGFILESVDGPSLPDPDELTIELQGLKPQSETAFKAEVKEALGLKIIEPREARQLLDLGRGLTGAYTSQSRHYRRARWLNLAIEKGEYRVQPAPPTADPRTGEPIEGLMDVVFPDGRPFVLPDDDDHAIHMLVLDEIALDEQKPWPTRQVALLVKAQRRRTVDLAQADASAPPQGQPQPQAA